MTGLENRYGELELLGAGAVGEVYRGRDSSSGEWVAIKLGHNDSHATALRAEFARLRRLAHPNLPAAHYFRRATAESAARPYFVMELVEGARWDTFWSEQHVDASERVDILLPVLGQLARVLGHLHAHGLAHGDLAPPNVLLCGSPPNIELKLLDLGLSAGGGPGALEFAAPERLSGAAPSPATDWFSVGLLITTALLGRFPFPDYPRQIPKQGLRLELPAGHARRLGPVVQRLLSIDPTERQLSAAQILEMLSDCSSAVLPQMTAAEVRVRARAVDWVEPTADSAISRPQVGDWIRDGSFAAVWVQGGLGSGRSRQLQEWADATAASGAEAILVRGRQADVGLELVQRLFDALWVDHAEFDSPAIPVLARDLLKVWRGGASAAESTPQEVDPRRERAQRIDALAVAFARLAAASRLALFVDDADVVDPESREFMQMLARLWATSAKGELAPAFLAIAGADPWLGEELASRRALASWDAGNIRQWIERLFPGRRVEPPVVDTLAQLSGGVPRLAVQVVGDLFEAGALDVSAHHVALAEPSAAAREAIRIGASMATWMQARLHELDAASRRVLALLALLEDDGAVELVAELAAMQPQEVSRSLSALVAVGLAVESDNRRGRCYGLAAPVEKALALAPLSEVERRQAHAAAAVRLADVSGAKARLFWAIHACCAVENIDDALGEAVADTAVALAEARAYPQVLRLADVAEARQWSHGSWEARLRFAVARSALALADFDRATRAFEELRQGAPAAVMQASALAWLGLTAFRKGDFGLATDRLERAVADLERANGSAVERGQSLVWLAQAKLFGGEYASALDRCEQAATALGSVAGHAAEAVRGRLAQTRGLAAFYLADLDAALHWFEAARGHFQQAGSPVDEANCDSNAALVHHRHDAYGEALQRYQRALKVFEALGDRSRQWATLMNIGVVHQEEGDYGRALDAYERSLALATALGDLGGVVRNTNNLGNALRAVGELSRAREYVGRSLDLSRQTRDRFIEGYNLALLGDLARLQSSFEEARQRLDEAAALFSELGCANERIEVEVVRAQLALDQGDATQARVVALGAVREARERGVRDLLARALTYAADAERLLPDGDVEAAAARLAEAEEVARTLGNREVLWAALLASARLHRERRQPHEAVSQGLAALDVLRELVDRLPATARRTYQFAGPRRGAFEELRWVDALARYDAARLSRAGRNPTMTKLLEINKRLSAEHDLVRLLEFIMDSAVLLTGAERGFLLLREAPGDAALQIKVARNFDRENIKNLKFKISRSIAERVIAEGEPIVTVDAMEDERYREYLSIHSLRLRSILCVPLRQGAEVAGVLYLDNRFQVSAFDEDDLRFMEAFADQAAIAIGNAQLLEEKEKAMAALERSRAEVAELNQQLQQKLADVRVALDETRTRVERQQRQLEGRHRYANIIGQSRALQDVLFRVERLLDNAIPVLIAGESGTGKELVARAVHYNGARRNEEFVAVNCGSIPSTLFESELFGHVRGSFTGAMHDKRGLFEVANKGTLFLDEIGEMPLEMQVKLLRVLQQGEIQKVGAPKPVRVDVRIVAATNRDLEAEVRAKRFREDLYYRLNVVQLTLPPLRQRPEDIPLLVQHFVASNQKAGITRVTGVSAEALALLSRYDWPGNIRQLDTVIKNASVFAEGEILRPADFDHIPELAPSSRGRGGAVAPRNADGTVGGGTLDNTTLAEIERAAIVRALERLGGNKKRAAEVLGIDRRTLYNKLASYGIEMERSARAVERTEG